jgi:segregation and condensation protein B
MVGEQEHPGDPLPLPVRALVESLLFVADEAVSIDRLASALELDAPQVEQALLELQEEYEARGLRVQQKRQRVQIVTAPEASPYIQRFLGLELTGRLSPAALETLAIVAYRQPVTRAQIEDIRGVNSDSVLRTLVNRGLVEELGRLDQAGRPIIYGTTFEFLQQFGLSRLEELPPLELDGDIPALPVASDSEHQEVSP